MHANLMRTSGIDSQFEQSEFPKSRFDPTLNQVMCDRPASALPASRHARPSDTIAADAARNCTSFLFRPTVYQSDICLSDLSLCKLSGQFAMCLVIFRHHN